MKSSLTDSPEDAPAYAEAIQMPTYWHIINGKYLNYDDFVKKIADWYGKVRQFNPVVSVMSHPSLLPMSILTWRPPLKTPVSS